MAHRYSEAFPTSCATDLDDALSLQGGLTKREYAAIHILAGLVGTHLRESAVQDVSDALQAHTVDVAVRLADRLLDAL